ncbi:AraC family transcriptional regulator [Streptomyces malaysiensis subsp. malaysiensis]|uniref:AraC family transcriptional regulator n=1 Tax=Streptomyces autolyticus TaxID=75293 RepID=A0ABM6HP58_9ACTN|nr:AraC family transcriptional regulator [Streptomyces autolyticus]
MASPHSSTRPWFRGRRRCEPGRQIRENYAEPLSIEELAKAAQMSRSSFHEHFKSVTAMSPLQYQKQLRLHAARRLILDGHADATTASRHVGYDSASQFSREYKRLFGAPPMRDIARIRATPSAVVA